METSVPMQYFITSYFAASSWALKEWISWMQFRWRNHQNQKRTMYNIHILRVIHTRSSLLVRLEVWVFWLASSSLIRLQFIGSVANKMIATMSLKSVSKMRKSDINSAYPLSRFKSSRCPAVTLSTSCLHHNPCLRSFET